ncbi:MAG: hypothetical protein ACK443_05645 [Methylococcaceae bacterium]|jgi:hypothetical protein
MPYNKGPYAAESFALQKAMARCLSLDNPLNANVPLAFGKRWAAEFQWTRKRLGLAYGNDVIAVCQVANRLFDFAKWRGAYEMTLAVHIPDEPFQEPHASMPEVYVEKLGMAMVAGEIVASINKPRELLADSPFDEYPDEGDLLDALALIWFFDAAWMNLLQPEQALDQLYEASAVHRMAHGFYMWDSNSPVAGDPPAVTMAYLSHREHREMADYVTQYWYENIEPKLSAQKAADMIVKANLVTLSHKKIAEIISRLRKEEGLR